MKKLIYYDGDIAKVQEIRDKFSQPGDEVTVIADDGTIKQCIGCFGCWIKTPGQCVLQDGYNDLGERLGKTDELIIVSYSVYGTFSPFIRNLMDRSLSYCLPDFTKARNNEWHHPIRYNKVLPVRYYIYGKIDSRDKETLLSLIRANVLNFGGTLRSTGFFDTLEEVSA